MPDRIIHPSLKTVRVAYVVALGFMQAFLVIKAVLEVGHDLVHIFLQCGENFVDRAHLPADAFYFGTDVPVLIAAVELGRRRGRNLAGGHLIESARDRLQRSQGKVRQSGREYQRNQNRQAGEFKRIFELRLQLALQED